MTTNEGVAIMGGLSANPRREYSGIGRECTDILLTSPISISSYLHCPNAICELFRLSTHYNRRFIICFC